MRQAMGRRLIITVAAATAIGLTLSGCVGDEAADTSDIDCSPYESYGTFDGADVTISGTIVEAEADRLNESWADYAACTDTAIEYQGTQEFEANIRTLAEGGNPPDLGIFPQPGLFTDIANGGFFKPAPEAVEANVDKFWTESWKGYGTVDGTFYGAPLMASIKGYVWYSPAEFEEKGYEIPTTLAELDDLAATIADEGDHKPWCASYASDAATGWPVTDWIEDYVLRQQGTEVYDQWYKHEIPFNDKRIVAAFDSVGDILKNPDMVGDVTAGLSIPFGEGGLPILDGTCSLHHQASFYEGFWGDGVTVAPDGDVFAFILPPEKEGDAQAVTGGGEIVGAFSDDEAVQAFQAFLSSDTWANNRVKLGGVISANSGVDATLASSPLLEQSIEILQDPESTIRFDASDLMPGAVGGNSFFKGIVDWIGGESSQSVADKIEASWPTS